MSSQHLHRVAKEMGLLPPPPTAAAAASSSLASSSTSIAIITITTLADHPVTTEEVLEKEAELCSRPQSAMQELEEQEEEERINQQAIAVMQEQLLEEELLPSLRPEEVLTKEQMLSLGEKKKSWDDIFNEITATSPILDVVLANGGSLTPSSTNNKKGDKGGGRHVNFGGAASLHPPRLSSRPPPPSLSAMPSRPLHLFGSLSLREGEKARVSELTRSEREMAKSRLLVLPPLTQANQPKPHELLTMSPEEFVAVNESLLAKGPRALKSRESSLKEGPKSPFASWTEEMAVLTHGIPSGAGLRLYRPHGQSNQQGRCRASHGQNTLKRPAASTAAAKPFVSAT
eukprot:scaffold4213_cov201-Ochromonas_danica.AAC.9